MEEEVSQEERAKVILESVIRDIARTGVLVEVHDGNLYVRFDAVDNWPGTAISLDW